MSENQQEVSVGSLEARKPSTEEAIALIVSFMKCISGKVSSEEILKLELDKGSIGGKLFSALMLKAIKIAQSPNKKEIIDDHDLTTKMLQECYKEQGIEDPFQGQNPFKLAADLLKKEGY